MAIAAAPEISRRPQLRREDRTLIALLLVSTFVVIFNETVMSLALPHLMTDLDISASTAQWVTTGFLLTMSVVIPATGFIMERFSVRQIYIAAMVLFSTGTLVAALAPGFPLLLTGRVIQAMGTGVMLPLLITTVMNLVPEHMRGRVMGVISIVISVAPAVGPTVSGVVLSRLSWRWLFLVVLPIALFSLVLGALKVRNVTTPRPARLDVLSLLLSAVGFGGLIYGLSSLGDASGHTPVAPWIPVLVGVIALVLFARRQFTVTGDPLLDLRVFGRRDFTVSTFVTLAGFVALFGGLILMPIYLQTVRDVSTLAAGLLVLPGGIAMGALSPLVGRLFDRFGPRPLVIPGAVVLSSALWLLATVGPTTALAVVVLLHVMLMSALALMVTPLMTSALGSLPSGLYGHGSAVLSTLQQLAGAAGTALFITVLSRTTASEFAAGATEKAATADGVSDAFIAGGVVSLVAVVAALLVRRTAAVDGPVH
ncbi:MDR family MFS transporter [Cryptosporangium sp. NPDC051539]|uniref:MDR family MFS transporter n=1 Tax=Cryptosporangium sp. NPDC051539 TaxID=3363962 RepID=UPI0037A657C5